MSISRCFWISLIPKCLRGKCFYFNAHQLKFYWLLLIHPVNLYAKLQQRKVHTNPGKQILKMWNWTNINFKIWGYWEKTEVRKWDVLKNFKYIKEQLFLILSLALSLCLSHPHTYIHTHTYTYTPVLWNQIWQKIKLILYSLRKQQRCGTNILTIK